MYDESSLSVTTRLGHRLYLDPSDERAAHLARAGGDLNPGSSQLWDSVLGMRSWDVVVDVGANYGEMVLGAAIPDGAKVVCFEPSPRVLPYLRRSLRESGKEIELREVAVGASNGTDTFAMDTQWSGRSGLAVSHRTDTDHVLATVDVSVRTLDTELDLPADASICVKVDVEGGELDVLVGASSLLTDSRSWAVMLEILHLGDFDRARLANAFTMSVLDRRTGTLVTVPPTTVQGVSELLTAGWLYFQDAVLTRRADR